MLVRDGGRPMADGDAHEEKALFDFATHTASDYLPRLARAARRVQEPRSSTFRKLGPVSMCRIARETQQTN